MQKAQSRIVVIGTSAGWMEALTRLLQDLPADFPAPVFIVQHLSPHSTGAFLVKRLAQTTQRPCYLAQHGEAFEPGVAYMAPADHHLLLRPDRMLVAKGPHENQFRPSIDPLFRSAAAHFGSRAGSAIGSWLAVFAQRSIRSCGFPLANFQPGYGLSTMDCGLPKAMDCGLPKAGNQLPNSQASRRIFC